MVRAELANHNVETITHTSTLDRVLRAELVNQNAETITTTNKLDRVSITSVAEKCFSLLVYL